MMGQQLPEPEGRGGRGKGARGAVRVRDVQRGEEREGSGLVTGVCTVQLRLY